MLLLLLLPPPRSFATTKKVTKGDVNPKDFILFYPFDFSPAFVGKDNTGRLQFTEDMVFPTLEFPSDHGILRTTLHYVDA